MRKLVRNENDFEKVLKYTVNDKGVIRENSVLLIDEK